MGRVAILSLVAYCPIHLGPNHTPRCPLPSTSPHRFSSPMWWSQRWAAPASCWPFCVTRTGRSRCQGPLVKTRPEWCWVFMRTWHLSGLR